MVVAIDRVPKFTYVEFPEDAGKMNRAGAIRGLINVTSPQDLTGIARANRL